MDRLEKELFELEKENIAIPDEILNKINSAFDEIRSDKDKNKGKKNLKRKYVAVAAGLALTTIVGLSSPVRAGIKDIIFRFNNPGIENAVNNQYIQNISDAEFKTKQFDIKINNTLVDNAHIALDFEFNIKDKSLISNNFDSKEIYLNMSLYDENDNIICKDGVLGSIGSIEHEIDISNIDNNILGYKMLFSSNSAEIPNMSKLKVNIDEIVFRNTQKNEVLLKENLNWNPIIELDEKFKQSSSKEYQFSNDNEYIKINNVKALPTGMSIDYDYFAPNCDENIVSKATLVDENGKIYRSSSCTWEDTANGGVNIKTVFDGLTSFENPQSFTLQIERPDNSAMDKIHFTQKDKKN